MSYQEMSSALQKGVEQVRRRANLGQSSTDLKAGVNCDRYLEDTRALR